MDEWLTAQIESRDHLPSIDLIAALLWRIWKARNSFIFRHKWPNPLLVVEEALAQVRISAPSSQPLLCTDRASSPPDHLWRPPDPDEIKLNIDGAYHQTTSQGAMACIFRDHTGTFLHGFTCDYTANSALHSEIQALLHTLDYLLQNGKHHQRLVLESDCLTLIDAVHNPSSTP
ncbi:uncharacterized protein LOC104435503 [Eucalyptus grandis]|uniref:uncharacterized protein LOC104435503 n=1 Tax=Eucalyptus grandis TaxID=71139 RepID=UPI00192E9E51|nr:uncharacterized protein LOC104435503 [Eucalyptus grandis]